MGTGPKKRSLASLNIAAKRQVIGKGLPNDQVIRDRSTGGTPPWRLKGDCRSRMRHELIGGHIVQR
jgi:hypothetical protein